MKRKIYWVVGVYFLVLIVLCGIYRDSRILFHIGTAELVAVALVVNVFVFFYLQRNWRANPYGRALMYSKISLAVLADLSLITLFFGPDWPWRAAARVILFGGVFVAQARLLQLLWNLRNEEARDKYHRENDFPEQIEESVKK